MKSQETKCPICGYTINVYPVIDCPRCGFDMLNPDQETVLMSIQGHQLGRLFFTVNSGNIILTSKRLICVRDGDITYRMFMENIIGGIIGVIIGYLIFRTMTYSTLSAGFGCVISMFITKFRRKNVVFSITMWDILSVKDEHSKMWKSFRIYLKDGKGYRFSSGQKDELIAAICATINE